MQTSRTTRRAGLALALVPLLALGVSASSADAAGRTATSFTVDTQFVDGPSDIIAASGPLAACTTVLDLSNNTDLKTHNQLVFTGVKQLTCGDATVTVAYEAFISLPGLQGPVVPPGGGFTTHGTWWVVDSTLEGVSSGGGQLMGDGRTCAPADGSGGCITDSFRGFVS